jgi:hypothetical protein
MVEGVLHRGFRLTKCLVLSCAALLVPARIHAQERITLAADLLFYGDNTEFRNPFREGETIFGTAGWLTASMDVNDRVNVSLGVFGNQRFGSADAFELVRPVATLTVRGGGSAFRFGTLPANDRTMADPAGDSGLHGLLPPLQRETMAFERPYEAGIQWTLSRPRIRHDAWLAWQRLNTPEHRERLDAGIAGDATVSRPVSLPFQLHVVHEGGQLFASGPVADSVAAAAGVRLATDHFAAVEIYALVSRYVPDRQEPQRSRDGAAVLGRASAGRSGWKAHVLFWRGDDFVKDEGDGNYQSLRRDGRYYRGVRDYAEAGIARTFHPAPGVALGASFRFHRVEAHYEYSYRIAGAVRLGRRVR